MCIRDRCQAHHAAVYPGTVFDDNLPDGETLGVCGAYQNNAGVFFTSLSNAAICDSGQVCTCIHQPPSPPPPPSLPPLDCSMMAGRQNTQTVIEGDPKWCYEMPKTYVGGCDAYFSLNLGNNNMRLCFNDGDAANLYCTATTETVSCNAPPPSPPAGRRLEERGAL